MPARRTLAIAHRGAHAKYPENSLPAILAALDEGADGIEIDVHSTSDGVLVVHHDPELRDGRQIAALSSKEFAAIEFEPGIRIPLLDDVLDAVAGKALLFIETKANGVESSVIRAIRRSTAESAVHSVHHDTIRSIKLTMPAIRVGILTSGGAARAVAAALAAGADDIWHEAGDVDAELVGESRRLGKQVIAWTANSKQECDRLLQLGVDGVCTDDLALL